MRRVAEAVGQGVLFKMNIYVGNLSFRTSDDELRSLFESYGPVRSASIVMDRETGRSRGFGFVEMGDEDAHKAISALNGQDIDGRRLTVNEARPRQGGGGGGGGPRPRYGDGPRGPRMG
jgi:cold-inducible RNA-binding protein